MNSKFQRGFTIVELMIATAVFSTILLVILTAVTQVGKMYYKGITTARTQEASRTIIDRISQEIEYSGSIPVHAVGASNGTEALCIGNSRYFYKINQAVSGTSHGVWYDTNGTVPAACTPAEIDADVNMSVAQPTVGGSELLPEGARVTVLNPTQSLTNPSLWSVSVKVVFGANDLLDTTDGSVQADHPELTICKGSAVGTQFCAISELSTTVLKRIQ